MLTLYELELEVRRRAVRQSGSGPELNRRRAADDMPQPSVVRTSTLWLAGVLRAAADRLEDRAFRTA